MEARRRPLLQLTSVLLLVAQLANAAPVLAAVAPAKSATARPSALVSQAQGLYRDARYDEAVGLLVGPILRKELAGDDLREARLVLARCYVKKGMMPRAKEYFGAVLAADPGFVLDASRADAEEMAVFNQVKGVTATTPTSTAGKPVPTAAKPPATPESAPAAATPAPQLHKPDQPASGGSQPGWLARNKFLAIAVVAGGGLVAGLAMGGGGGGSSTPPGPRDLGAFPAPPGGH